MIHFLLLQNRQGKTRFAKFYSAFEHEEKRQLQNEVHKLITKRDPKFTNFIEVHYHTLTRSLSHAPAPARIHSAAGIETCGSRQPSRSSVASSFLVLVVSLFLHRPHRTAISGARALREKTKSCAYVWDGWTK